MMAAEKTDLCTLLGGAVRLRQYARGFRAGIDAVLLSSFVKASGGKTVLDIGCGVGTVALCLAARYPELHVTGIEAQKKLACLAQKNIHENNMAGRVKVIHGCLQEGESHFQPHPHFDHVVTNPPFYPAGTHRAPQDASRLQANIEGDLTLQDWLRLAARWVRPGGSLTLIHLANRLDDVLRALPPYFGALDVVPIAPRVGQKAIRVLIRGWHGHKGVLRLHAPLTLHDSDGHQYSEKVLSLLGSPSELRV